MKSLRFKITMYFVGLILLMLVVFMVGMNNFIDDYYYSKKIEAMDLVVDEINKRYAISESEDEALMYIEYLGYHFEGKISIFDKSTKLIIFNSKGYEYTRGKIIEEISYHGHTAYVYETAYPVEGARWLMYIEELDNGKIALLQVSVLAIDEAIGVVQSFFKYLMAVVFAAAMILAMILARSISAPIKQLHQVAESIGDLSFNIKYLGKREDEIGQLGCRLNQIGETLEKNICDLNKELEKGRGIDKMRRRFVATVSHELQTPISIISSYIEALSDGILEEDEVETYYQVIEEESVKMSTIVKDLLQLSQLESDNVNFKSDLIDFKSFMTKILDKYEPLARARNIEFSYDLPGLQGRDCLCIKGDSLKLEQGITNILNNGLKHSDEYLRVDLTQASNKLILSIENSGDLIEPQDLSHIFDSFYKGKTRKKVEGTGLGLSIASRIFDKHSIKYRAYNKTESVVFELEIDILEDDHERE